MDLKNARVWLTGASSGIGEALVAPLVALKTFALPFDALDCHEVLLWHKRNEPDPGHAWLRTLFIEVAREP